MWPAIGFNVLLQGGMNMGKKRVIILMRGMVVAGFLLAQILFADVIPKASAEPRGSIRIGIVGEIDPLNPNETVNQNTETVVFNIYDKLIVPDGSMNLHPSLATSWEVAPDGSALIFRLRKGVKFHDGTLFDANAVKVTFDRMKNEKLKRWPSLAPFIKSVEVMNENTVKIHLQGSPSSALTVLSVVGYIESPAAIKKYGKEIGSHPIGTGPFKFVEWVPDQRITLEANRDYWGGEPKIARVVFRPVPDTNSRLAMVEAGDLDVAIRPPYTDIERLKSVPGLQVDDAFRGSVISLQMNTVKEPITDKRVRQAISYGIDRRAMVKSLLFNLVRLADAYATPGVKHILKYDIYPYDPNKSKSILAGLGWKPGKSGFLEKDGEVLRTTLSTPSGRYPMDREIAEAIQAQLKTVGIDVKVAVLESAAFVKSISGDPQAKKNSESGLYIGSRMMGPDLDSAFTMHFHSNSFPPKGMNVSIFSNNELDRLLEEGARTIDETKRGAIYKRVQDIINEEVPWLPIYSVVEYVVLKKGIKGVGYPNPFGYIYVSKDAEIGR
jgi:peptide/nickel transport system substrate-binding protein